MEQHIPKSVLVAEIESKIKKYTKRGEESDAKCDGYGMYWGGVISCLNEIRTLCDTLEVKEVDLENELNDFIERQKAWVKDDWVVEYNNGDSFNHIYDLRDIAKHFFELGNKAQKGEIWQVVDNVNYPQADKNKIYCVFTKDRYILAKVINHPKDEELLQWKCTEFPHHRYDMCEGDKYMQIV